jgi:hypothetical protein
MEYLVWDILEWFDNNINHKFIDPLTNWFPLEKKDGSDSLFYTIWENTSQRYCSWVNDTLVEKWSIVCDTVELED